MELMMMTPTTGGSSHSRSCARRLPMRPSGVVDDIRCAGLGFHQIAQASYGPYRDAGVLQLLADAVHVNLYRVGADVFVPLVEAAHHRVLAHDATRSCSEDFTHRELACRER